MGQHLCVFHTYRSTHTAQHVCDANNNNKYVYGKYNKFHCLTLISNVYDTCISALCFHLYRSSSFLDMIYFLHAAYQYVSAPTTTTLHDLR